MTEFVILCDGEEVPEENVRDLDEIDREAKESLCFIPCKTVEEVLSHTLI